MKLTNSKMSFWLAAFVAFYSLQAQALDCREAINYPWTRTCMEAIKTEIDQICAAVRGWSSDSRHQDEIIGVCDAMGPAWETVRAKAPIENDDVDDGPISLSIGRFHSRYNALAQYMLGTLSPRKKRLGGYIRRVTSTSDSRAKNILINQALEGAAVDFKPANVNLDDDDNASLAELLSRIPLAIEEFQASVEARGAEEANPIWTPGKRITLANWPMVRSRITNSMRDSRECYEEAGQMMSQSRSDRIRDMLIRSEATDFTINFDACEVLAP